VMVLWCFMMFYSCVTHVTWDRNMTCPRPRLAALPLFPALHVQLFLTRQRCSPSLAAHGGSTIRRPWFPLGKGFASWYRLEKKMQCLNLPRWWCLSVFQKLEGRRLLKMTHCSSNAMCAEHEHVLTRMITYVIQLDYTPLKHVQP